MKPHPNLSRRQFLVHSAAVAGASVGLRVTRAGERGASPLSEARLGFIGLGDRGRHLLGAAMECPEARIAAVCDIHPQHLKRALDIAAAHCPRGFTNYRALLDAADIDAVFIATPVFLHHAQALTALAAGKHVYCEKPMALNADECREVLEACRAAEERGQIYQSGFQRRYSPRYRQSLRFLREEGGPVHFVRAQWHAVGAARKDKPWLFRRDKSGDIVLEQACHQFDIFNWVFDAPPLHACAFGGSRDHAAGPPGRDVSDHYGAVLEYPGGGKVHYSHLTYSVPERRFSGIYELAFCAESGVDLGGAIVWDAAGRSRELCTERGSETQLAVAAFLRALIRGERPEASAEVGYRATLAALLCRTALESGRRVSWSELEA